MSLEMRDTCETCRAALAHDARAFVCSHECTFCPSCAREGGAPCPNCGGELVRRPMRGVPGGAPPVLVEVSHTIEPGMKTYPGLPEPRAEVLLDYETSRAKFDHRAEFLIASLHLCGNTGTYVDAPIHRHRGAADLASLSLSRLAHVPCVVVDVAAGDTRAIGPDAFRDVELAGRAVLVHTGFSRHWRTDGYFSNNPFLTADACDLLVRAGAAVVGIDSLNIDDVGDLSRPAHTRLLGAGIPVCEHMTNLAAVPRSGSRFHAAPIAWVGGATFPVRAYVVAGA